MGKCSSASLAALSVRVTSGPRVSVCVSVRLTHGNGGGLIQVTALTWKICRCQVAPLNLNRTDKSKSFHRLKTNNKNKQNYFVSSPQMKSTQKVLCDSKITRVEME